VSESLKLGLKVGDYVEWVGPNTDSPSGHLKPGMLGRVIKASDNILSSQMAVLTGADVSSPWVLVEFENSVRVVVRKASELQRINVQ